MATGFISDSFNCADGRDVILYTLRHSGILPVGASYTESFSVQVPHAIHGTYFFIVVTDLFNNVYEHIRGNDNTNSSQVCTSYTLTVRWLSDLVDYWLLQAQGKRCAIIIYMQFEWLKYIKYLPCSQVNFIYILVEFPAYSI